MRWFIIGYVALEVFFHFFCIFISDELEVKQKVIYVLASITLAVDLAMFCKFLPMLSKYFSLSDAIHRAKHGRNPSKLRRYTRTLLVAGWALVFTLDIIYGTFLRPAGTLEFSQQSLIMYVADFEGRMATLRKVL